MSKQAMPAATSSPQIIARELCVEFPVGNISTSLRGTVSKTVGGLLGRANGSGFSVKALNNLNFELKAGDRIGLVGHNGAGKSTLLQTLNGGYFPTSGSLDIVGRVVPLLNLGNGADLEFSGHENITLLGLHMGLTPGEIEAKREEIAEFSELGDFLNLPLRSYSAGMYLRLMFAIGTSVEPDILLLDEMFGAGDQSFFNKAQERMESIIEQSGILLFASHSTRLIEQYCNQVMVMQKGEIAFRGEPQEAFGVYAELLESKQA